jgi:hypothetical protein
MRSMQLKRIRFLNRVATPSCMFALRMGETLGIGYRRTSTFRQWDIEWGLRRWLRLGARRDRSGACSQTRRSAEAHGSVHNVDRGFPCAIRPTHRRRLGIQATKAPTVRGSLRITHPGSQPLRRAGGANSLVFSGESHFHPSCSAVSLAVGKRSGCVFRPQRRTNSGARDAVSIRERTSHCRRI